MDASDLTLVSAALSVPSSSTWNAGNRFGVFIPNIL